MSTKNDLCNVISKYDFPVQQYLEEKNFYGMHAATLKLKYMKTMPTPKVCSDMYPRINLVESLQNIVKYALHGLPEYSIDQRFGLGDTFVFGDVHAQLDLFIQNLYIAGLISKDGSLRDNLHPKTMIQVGDTINRGPFSWETTLYLNFLQDQAKAKGHRFIRLIGNHEYYLLSHKQSEIAKEYLQQVLKKDIIEKRIQLSYCDPDKRVLFMHGGLQKETLLRTLEAMSKDDRYQALQNILPQLKQVHQTIMEKRRIKDSVSKIDKRRYHQLQKETSSEKLYQMLSDCEIRLTDVSEWMNQQLNNQAQNDRFNITLDNHFLFGGPDSIMESYRKANGSRHPERMQNGEKSFLISHKESYKYRWKPIQITGHNPTDLVISSCGNERGIKQNKANIFVDANLTRDMGANQAYLMIDKARDRIFAVEMLDTREPSKLFTEDDKPFGLAMKVPYFKIRRLQGINMYDHDLKREFQRSSCFNCLNVPVTKQKQIQIQK